MITILHLSDIHRATDDPVTAAELVAALESDRRRWPDEAADGPALVVVSGDLVQGARLGAGDSDAELSAQYQDAARFLDEIAVRFVSGDRARVVIVPGNHDVDWNIAYQSMAAVPLEEVEALRKDLPQAIYAQRPGLRWDWTSMALMRVEDHGLYEARCDRFREFRREFYASAVPDPLAIDDDLFFLAYPDLDLSISGFSSWFGNDCFCHVGAFDPDLLAKARDALTSANVRLHIAVWHHSTSGWPTQSDFVDVRSVHRLIDYGYRIGLHGHQHRADATVVTLKMPTMEEMALISAGSFSASSPALPPGVNRQYNLISVGIPERTARVHVREAISELVFAASARTEFGGQSFVDLQWSESPAFGPLSDHTLRTLDDAFTAFGRGDLQAAQLLLDSLPVTSPGARQLQIEIYLAQSLHQDLVALISEPQNQDELVVLVNTLCGLRDGAQARAALERHADRLAVSRDLLSELEARVLLEESSHDQ